MNVFGIIAINQFKTLLKDYPEYCQDILKYARLDDFPPDLVNWIRFGANGQKPSEISTNMSDIDCNIDSMQLQKHLNTKRYFRKKMYSCKKILYWYLFDLGIVYLEKWLAVLNVKMVHQLTTNCLQIIC